MSEDGGALDHPVKSAQEGTKHAGKGIKGLLTRKVGPLPVGLWIVGIGGGLLAATWLRRSYAAGSPAEAALDGYDTPEGTGGAAMSEPGYVGQVPDDFYTPGDSETPAGGQNGTRKFKDNNAWKKAAIDAATGNGMSGISVQRALDRYLSGKRLNKSQRQTVDMLLATVGAPPKPVPTPPRPQNGQQAGQGHGGGGNGGGHGGSGGGGHGGKGDGKDDGKGWAPATHAQAAHQPPHHGHGPRRQDKPQRTNGGRRHG